MLTRLFSRALTAVLVGAALLLSTRGALAEKQATSFAAVGPLVTYSGHVDLPATSGLGLELSFMHYPWTPYFGGVGGFFQAQSVGFDHAQVAFGPQVSFLVFGAELGAFVEGASLGRATTLGIQASPFISVGFFSVAFRMGFPLAGLSAGEKYATALGAVFTFKYAFPLEGSYIALHE